MSQGYIWEERDPTGGEGTLEHSLFAGRGWVTGENLQRIKVGEEFRPNYISQTEAFAFYYTQEGGLWSF